MVPELLGGDGDLRGHAPVHGVEGVAGGAIAKGELADIDRDVHAFAAGRSKEVKSFFFSS